MAFREGIEWIVEADIKGFFDSVIRRKLVEMLQTRVADGRFLRLVGKCLHVGVLEGGSFSIPTEGTAQGSIISPLLGNIYLHHVLDLWFEQEVRPRLTGYARLIRYADDFVIGFHRKEDAERVLGVLHKRMERFGLMLHPDKTRIVRFGRPRPEHKRAETEVFDFLGFTVFWRRSRKGRWILGMKTRKASFRKAIKALGDWCRRHRHWPLKEQQAALNKRLRGHDNHFAVNGNYRKLWLLRHELRRVWFKWLKRRHQGQRPGGLTWEKFQKYLKRFPLLKPRIKVRIWA
jgi:group II intron reverse transcriptase/maturase